MRRFAILILVCFFKIIELVAQTENNKLLSAEDLFLRDNFSEALPIYQYLLQFDSSNANLNFKIGICYLKSRSQKAAAVNYLEKAVFPFSNYDKSANGKGRAKLPDTLKSVPIIAYKFLGDAYYLNLRFDMAIACYKKFENNMPDDYYSNLCLREEIDNDIAVCNLGSELACLRPFAFKLKKICKNKITNSLFNHFIFNSVTDQFVSENISKYAIAPNFKINDDLNYFEDYKIPIESDSSRQSSVDGNQRYLQNFSNRDSIKKISNEANVGTSMDGHFVLTYKNIKGDGNLYTTSLKDNQWTLPEKLNKTINSKGWEQNEFISADGNTLYFTSDRKGGYGGEDIYKCKKLPNGEWGKAANLGPTINTAYDEEAPFILPDGRTLYFSSNGYKKINSFDIFTSTLSDNGTWTKPVNIGYPANTNDYQFPETDERNEKIAEKLHSLSIKENDENNNYLITFFNDNRSSVTLINGSLTDQSEKVIKDIKIVVADNETGKISGIYYPNKKSGKFLLIIPTEKNINITFEAEGYLFLSEHFDISKETNNYKILKIGPMLPITKGSIIVLNNVFFDSGQTSIRSDSNIELKNILNLLTNNQCLKVEISEFIYPKRYEKYNKKFALERAQGIVNYLVEKGINKERIIGKGVVGSKFTEGNGKTADGENARGEALKQRLELKILEIGSK